MIGAVLAVLWKSQPAEAHESCCKFKLQQAQPEFILDPLEEAPALWQGESQFMDDPDDSKPGYWDDEDDGEWKPSRIPNPKYNWEPRLIPNPLYVPPPTYWDKLKVEILAATPWVTLGLLVTGTLSLVLPSSMESFLHRCLRDDPTSGMLGRLLRLGLSAVLGLATPLCSCGALPLCAGLIRTGVPLASAVTFLTASQSAGLDSAAITLGLLGLPAMVGRLLGALLLAVAVGLACPASSFPTNALKVTQDMDKRKESAAPPTVSLSGWIAVCAETAREVCPSVLLGLGLSTAALHYLPSLIDYENASTSWGVSSLAPRLLTLVSAVPLQLCEHTSVTLAAAIQKAGFSPGLAFAFLLSAPALNLPSLLLLCGAASPSGSPVGVAGVTKVAMALSGSALALSYAVDALGLDLLAGEAAGEMALLPSWFTETSPFMAGGLLVAGILRKRPGHAPPSQPDCSDCCASTTTNGKPKEE